MSYDSKFKNEAIDRMFEAVLSLETEEDCYRFFEDLCTVKELQEMSQRYHVARMLADKRTYTEIEKETGASTATISRINKCLVYGANGYKSTIDKIKNK
ncbi:MAG TPA: YerC/YecD family TrpR-related protein [Anaerovoracaceae bacterium]|nr:YerC/YecD family TrpR-related protein [Anaerovoracaceae bacterium]